MGSMRRIRSVHIFAGEAPRGQCPPVVCQSAAVTRSVTGSQRGVSVNTHAFSWMRGRAALYAAAALGAGVLALGAFAPAAAQTATATTLYVSQGGSDTAPCTSSSPCATVSHALTQAASGATIEVSGTINDHLNITSPVTITTWPGSPPFGPGALNGTANGHVVNVGTGVTGVTLHDLTIENGSATFGGGIYNNGTLTLTDSTVSGNSGSGIYNYQFGTMTIIDSTVAKNLNGDGIHNGHTMTVIASTISGNPGYGISSSGNSAVAHLGATIVAGNTTGNCLAGAAGNIASSGYNLTNDTTGTACSFSSAAHDLVGKNPLLGPLASNGGPTPTMLPATKSPAANGIPNPTTLSGITVCPGTDQRGVARPGHGETGCTIGAVEAALNIATTTSVTLSQATVTAGTRVIYLAVVTPKTGTGTPTGTITFTTGSTTLCTAVLSGGAAACGATNAPVGTDTVTGTYSGGGGDASSSGTATLTVT